MHWHHFAIYKHTTKCISKSVEKSGAYCHFTNCKYCICLEYWSGKRKKNPCKCAFTRSLCRSLWFVCLLGFCFVFFVLSKTTLKWAVALESQPSKKQWVSKSKMNHQEKKMFKNRYTIIFHYFGFSFFEINS